MIIHRHHDGSEGYQYEVGDRVIVDRTVPGGWFDLGPKSSDKCIVDKVDKKDSWRIAMLEIRFSPIWGTVSCLPWGIRPHADALSAATVILVPGK